MEIRIWTAMILLFLIGCGESDKKPSTEDYEKQFAVTIPAYFQLDAFDIEASENIGSKVEPIFKARFKATVKLKTETYEIANQKEGAIFIRPVASKGDKKEVYGIATAQLFAGNWKIHYDLENNPVPAMGHPRDFFTGQKVILVGSPEEANFEEEQRLAEERANVEQRKMLADAPRLIAGTWRDENSLATYQPGGKATFLYDNGRKANRTWSITDDILTLTIIELDGKPYDDKNPQRYRIIEFTSSKFTVANLKGGAIWHATRVK